MSRSPNYSYGIEPPLVWRRHRLPTITVQADTAPGLEAATVVKVLSSEITAFKSQMPAGYDVVVGGTVEESAKAEASIFAVFPVMILIMITILMVQLQSFQRLFLVLATAPLALIGVAAALLIARAPMGFVAILGIVSLIGMGDPQLGDPDRPDRYRNCRGSAAMERGDRAN